MRMISCLIAVFLPILAARGVESVVTPEKQTAAQKISALKDLPKAHREKAEFVTFRAVATDSQQRVSESVSSGKPLNPGADEEILILGSQVGEKVVEETLVVKKAAIIHKGHVAKCHAYFEREWRILIELNEEGRKLFGNATTAMVGDRLAIVINGSVAISAPVVTGPIPGGQLSISGGNMDEAEANLLASLIEGTNAQPLLHRSLSPLFKGTSDPKK